MATAYHRDQPGAPNPVYPVPIYSIGQFEALKIVLKGCLVYGYSARPAAGWVLVDEGETYIVLRTGSHSGYVCFTWTNNVVTIYLAATYTGVVSNVITGDGVKSGILANAGKPQRLDFYGPFGNDNATSWSLVADNKTFILTVATGNNGISVGPAGPSTSAPYHNFTVYVGEDSAGNLISAGGKNHPSVSPTTTNNYFCAGPDYFGFTSLKNPATGFLVGANSLNAGLLGVLAQPITPIYMLAGSEVVPDTVLAPIEWAAGGVYAGRLRGLAVPLNAAFSTTVHSAMARLGNAGATVRQLNLSADLSDGYSYFPKNPGQHELFFLITDNPEFW